MPRQTRESKPPVMGGVTDKVALVRGVGRSYGKSPAAPRKVSRKGVMRLSVLCCLDVGRAGGREP